MTQFPAALDELLCAFCADHGLSLDTQYRDDEVRSITVVDDQAGSYQLWVEPHGVNWMICAWDKIAERRNFETTLADLPSALQTAWAEISDWIEAKGHTRSAV